MPTIRARPPTSASPYGQGAADALAWVNQKGGVAASKVNVDTVDYGYQVPRAVAQYKKWSVGDKVAAIMGWGTADTEALTGFVAQDQIPDISASYAAALTDPAGSSNKAKPAPYNFFYGPNYSDALRAMLIWAAEDWKAKGKSGPPKFVHMGANHPYPNAPKEAGEAIAKELGFEVLPAVQFALTPGDYSGAVPDPQELRRATTPISATPRARTSRCSRRARPPASTSSSSATSGAWTRTPPRPPAMPRTASMFPLRTAVAWDGEAPGMTTMRRSRRMSDPAGSAYRRCITWRRSAPRST